LPSRLDPIEQGAFGAFGADATAKKLAGLYGRR
jgi:hypothetical protein